MTMQGHQLKALRKSMNLRQAALAHALGITPQFVGMMERDEKPIETRTALSVLYLVDHPEARPDDEPRAYSPGALVGMYLSQAGLYDGRTWGRWRFSSDSLTLDLDSREEVIGHDDEGNAIVERRERYYVPLNEMHSARVVLNWIGQVAGKAWGAVTLGHFVEALDDIFGLQATFFHGKGYQSQEAVMDELRARISDAG